MTDKTVKRRQQKHASQRSHIMNFFRQIKNKLPSRRSWIVRLALLWGVAFCILESFLFKNFLNPSNTVETFPRELAFPTLINILSALLAAVIILLVKRPGSLAAKLASVLLLALLFADYDARLLQSAGVFRAIIPILPKPDNDLALISLLLLGILVLVTCAGGVYIEKLQSKYKSLDSTNIIGGILIIVGVVFASQAINTVRVLPTLAQESNVTPPSLGQPARTANGEKPDIFYIVLDRYANSETLGSQFNYDNTSFTNKLRETGFTVRDEAYSNYPFTASSVASTINAQYTNDIVQNLDSKPLQSHTLYHNLTQNSAVVKALKDTGYQYYVIGSWYGTSNRAPLAERDYMWDNRLTVLGRAKNLRGLEASEFNKSIFYRFATLRDMPGWQLKLEQRNQVDNVREQLRILNNLTTKEQAGGRFIFAHILVPHDPFHFNADGSLSANPEPDNIGRTNKDKYLGQLQFINGQLRQLIDNIQTQSQGRAVVIVNADEGPYPTTMNATALKPAATTEDHETNTEDMRTWPDEWLRMKYGILQAVHIPAATKEDLDNLSSVNIFRIVLNRYAGYSLPYLPNCHFGFGAGGQQYKYIDLTPRLDNQNSPQCQEMVGTKK